MMNRFLKVWDGLSTSFWFVPSLMVLSSILLALVMLKFDRSLGEENWFMDLTWQFQRGPEGSRSLLSVVAGSMMTITSVTFSITILTLQLASSQFGPRLLRSFMRDRGNQVVLGTFIATFTYCLLVLREVNGSDVGEEFVPQLAVAMAVVLALASLSVLIYFIHHVAESIQAENIIDAASRDLEGAIDRLYPESMGRDASKSRADPPSALPDGFESGARPVTSESSNYVQMIDEDRLMDLARKHDLVVRLEVAPGRFLIEGAPMARVWPGHRGEEVAEAVRTTFILGRHPTLHPNIRFAIDQLVEIALRAMSTGVNDPFTAMNCIDRIGSALRHLIDREFPSPYRADDEGRLRVVADRETFASIADAAFDPLREAVRNNLAVTVRLLSILAVLARQARDPSIRDTLRQHANRVHLASREGLEQDCDLEAAEQSYQAAVRACSGSL
ncbi:DUF2254 domain-containing protein [soil metagenome]